MEIRSVADLEGPWVEPELNSGLIQRCRANWSVPIGKLTNHVLATFLRQRKALPIVIPEAKRRISTGHRDDTELFEDELEVALSLAECPKS